MYTDIKRISNLETDESITLLHIGTKIIKLREHYYSYV